MNNKSTQFDNGPYWEKEQNERIERAKARGLKMPWETPTPTTPTKNTDEDTSEPEANHQ